MFKLVRGLLLLLTLWSTGLFADTIEIIDLKSRPAEEIIPILKPMLDSNGAITGNGFQIILRTSPANLQQMRQMIERLDKAPAQLMVSVFQGSEYDLDKISSQLAIQYNDNNTTIKLGQTGRHNAPTARSDQDNLAVSGSIRSTRAHTRDNPVHQLRIMEGSSGYIETGYEIPYFSGNVYRSRGHAIVEGGIDYINLPTGFYVRPLVNNQRVTLDINPYKNSPSRHGGGIIDTQSAATTVTGPVGQWMEIGGVATESRSSGKSIGKQYKTRERQSSRLWIRADLLD